MSVQLLTMPEAGARLGASRATAYRLIAAGLLTPHYIGTGTRPRVRIDEAELDAFIRSRADSTQQRR